MKNKRTVLKITFFAILIMTILSSIFISLSISRQTRAEDVVREVTTPMISLVSAPFEAVKTFTEDLVNLQNVQEENQALKAQMNDYFLLKNENDQLQQENDQLKELMNMSESIHDATTIYSTVLYRNAESFDNFIQIDSGTADGVQEGQAVINEKGLIGIVTSANQNTSEVTLLTNSVGNAKVTCEVTEVPGSVGYLSTYSTTENVFYINGIDFKYQESIKKGQTLVTSGYDEGIPKGIPIGVVEGWETDPVTQEKVLVVTPFADFNQITNVGVMVK